MGLWDFLYRRVFGLKETSETHPLGKPVPKVMGLYNVDFLKQFYHKKKIIIQKKIYVKFSFCPLKIYFKRMNKMTLEDINEREGQEGKIPEKSKL